MTKKTVTIHEVKDKPKIVVDKNSPAAYLVASKFIDPQETYKIYGRSSVDAEGEENDGRSDDDDSSSESGGTVLQAPEFTDIFLKRNGSFENLNPSNKYGVLYNVSGTSRALVELEFKVMIPLELVDVVTGIEILSDNEVVAEL
jgi:hypothetical protein